MDTIRLSLDWTPNTNHIGMYTALAAGRYAEAGIRLEIWTPDQDGYATTPARRLAHGETDVAITPSESVISLHTAHRPVSVQAIATVLQRDASGIAVLADTGIRRPAELDGKRYASYSARFEDHIVAAMIRADGGAGRVTPVKPERLGIWETLLTGEAEATWIFVPWEGVLARRDGIDLRVFTMEEFGVPYGYSPVLVARTADLEGTGSVSPEALSRFVQATRLGYEQALADRELAVAAFRRQVAHHPALESADMLNESLTELAPYLVNESGQWGRMNSQRWQDFADWIHAAGLIERRLLAADLCRNLA